MSTTAVTVAAGPARRGSGPQISRGPPAAGDRAPNFTDQSTAEPGGNHDQH